jgi:2'-5' RNA ligase
MNFGIVIFPPKDVQDAANSYRKRFDPHYNLIQPHLTVREAEEWDPGKLDLAVKQLTETVRTLQPLTVRINRFSTFYPVTNVVYMAVEDPQPLCDLQTAICSGVLDMNRRSYTFCPHVTVAQGVGEDEMHDIYSSLRPIPLDMTFEIDRVHLMFQTENGAWTAHQTFLFQG